MKVTLTQVKKANPKWFTPENKAFFHDVDYCIFDDNEGKPYLVRSTYAWTDMFGKKPRLHCRINPLSEELGIEPLFDVEFADFDGAQEWLLETEESEE